VDQWLIVIAGYLGLVTCALICAVSAFYGIFFPKHAKRSELLLLASMVGFTGPLFAAKILQWLSLRRLARYDYYVFHWDGLVQFQPSFAVANLFQHIPFLAFVSGLTYDFMCAAPVLVFALYLFRRSKREAFRIALAFLVNLFGALPIYLLFPVSGPAYAFPGFPGNLPEQLIIQPIRFISAPPNGVPSVHFSTALLVFWFLRRWRLGIVCGSVYVGLTALGTLGSGEHYLFDLIAAIPYAAAVYWLVMRPIWQRLGAESTPAKVHILGARENALAARNSPAFEG
jgi:hypothetical protein